MGHAKLKWSKSRCI